jgi:hypothetical protein
VVFVLVHERCVLIRRDCSAQCGNLRPSVKNNLPGPAVPARGVGEKACMNKLCRSSKAKAGGDHFLQDHLLTLQSMLIISQIKLNSGI